MLSMLSTRDGRVMSLLQRCQVTLLFMRSNYSSGTLRDVLRPCRGDKSQRSLDPSRISLSATMTTTTTTTTTCNSFNRIQNSADCSAASMPKKNDKKKNRSKKTNRQVS